MYTKEAEASDEMQRPFFFPLELGEIVDFELFEETFYVNIWCSLVGMKLDPKSYGDYNTGVSINCFAAPLGKVFMVYT